MGNDGETGPITLLGCSGAEKGFKVTYEDTGTDITDDVVAGTYDSEIGTGPRAHRHAGEGQEERPRDPQVHGQRKRPGGATTTRSR